MKSLMDEVKLDETELGHKKIDMVKMK